MTLDQSALEAILFHEFEGVPDACGRGSHWTADHCRRVAHLAVTLRKAVGECPQLDDLVYFSGLFHDVCHDTAFHEHGEAGARRVRELLAGKVPAPLLERAAAIIAVHDDKRPPDASPYDTATHLVQDADLLDHNGALQIYQCICYGQTLGMSFAEELDHLERKTLPLWRKKTALFHFAASRAEWERRTAFVEAFLRRGRREEAPQLFADDAVL